MPNPAITQSTPTSPYTIVNSKAVIADMVLTAGVLEGRFVNLGVDTAATGLVIELVQQDTPVRIVAVVGPSGSDATVPGFEVGWQTAVAGATSTVTLTVTDSSGGGFVNSAWTLRAKVSAPATWVFDPEPSTLLALSRVLCDPVAVLSSTVVGAVPEKNAVGLTAAVATTGTVVGSPVPTATYRFRSGGATAVPPLPACSASPVLTVTMPGVLRDSAVDLMVEVAFADCATAGTAWLRNVSPATTVTIRPRPHQIAVLLDRSGSMAGDRWRNAVAAARTVVRLFGAFRSGVHADDRIALLAFEDTGCAWGPGGPPLTPALLGPSDTAAADDAVCATPLGSPGACTPIGQGLVAAMDLLAGAGRPTDVRYAIVLLTDGYENSGPVQVGPGTPPAGVQAFAVARTGTAGRTFVNQRLALFTVGLGSTVDEPVLNNLPAITAGGGEYLKVTDPAQLATAFGQMLSFVHEANPVPTSAGPGGRVRFLSSSGADRLVVAVLAGDGTVNAAFRPAGSADPFVAGPAAQSCPAQDGVAVHAVSVLDVPALGVTGAIEWEIGHSAGPLATTQVLAYEDLKVNARLVLDQHAYRVGDTMEVTVHLRDGGEPIRKASVVAEVVAPTTGLGEALTTFSPRYDPTPLDGRDLPVGKGHMVAALLRSLGLTDLPAAPLTGVFVDGTNELHDVDGTGDYRNTFARFDHEGTYTWRVVVDGVDTRGAPFRRTASVSTWAGLRIDPAMSSVTVTDLGSRPSGLTATRVDVVPRDSRGRVLGPFWDADVVFTVDVGRFEGSEQGEPQPSVLFDGTYRRVALYGAGQTPLLTVSVTGSKIGPFGLPPGRPKNPPKDPPKDAPKDGFKDGIKDPLKDGVKDGIKDPIKDGIKDPQFDPVKLKDIPKDPPKDIPKDRPKDRPKDLAKDATKEFVRKEVVLDRPLGPIDLAGFDPFNAVVQPGTQGLEPPGAPVVPFTLATGPEAQEAGEPGTTGVPEVDALRPLRARFMQLHRLGLLGPDDVAEWQRLEAHVRHLLGGDAPA